MVCTKKAQAAWLFMILAAAHFDISILKLISTPRAIFSGAVDER